MRVGVLGLSWRHGRVAAGRPDGDHGRTPIAGRRPAARQLADSPAGRTRPPRSPSGPRRWPVARSRAAYRRGCFGSDRCGAQRNDFAYDVTQHAASQTRANAVNLQASRAGSPETAVGRPAWPWLEGSSWEGAAGSFGSADARCVGGARPVRELGLAPIPAAKDHTDRRMLESCRMRPAGVQGLLEERTRGGGPSRKGHAGPWVGRHGAAGGLEPR